MNKEILGWLLVSPMICFTIILVCWVAYLEFLFMFGALLMVVLFGIGGNILDKEYEEQK